MFFKAPLFKIEPLIDNYYLEQLGDKKISFKEQRSISKSIKKLSGKIKDPIRWIYLEGKNTPVLMVKSGDDNVFLTGSLKLKKAKTNKDLEYWKKKLADILDKDTVEKSLQDILFPMVKSLPEGTEELLIKARGFAVGTIREWKGKKYKKVASGRWVRTYSEAESRGAKQAIRNVKKKIMEAESMEDLVKIIQENKARFADENGKALPIVKEFLESARATEAGEKKKQEIIPESPDGRYQIKKMADGRYGVPSRISPKTYGANADYFDNLEDAKKKVEENRAKEKAVVDALKRKDKDGDTESQKEITPEKATEAVTYNQYDAEEMIDELNEVAKDIPELEFYMREEFDEEFFSAEVNRGDSIENIEIDPNDYLGKSPEELKEMFEIKTGRGEDNQKRKERSDKGSEKEGIPEEQEEKPKPRIKTTIKKPSDVFAVEYDPALDPNSPEYKYRDTGYIGGSRKELASLQIKELKKSGATVVTRKIDWSDLESNPREAETLIKKSNLFGLVDWQKLQDNGMESGTGFLIDRIYASIAPKPENDPIKRKDYAYGIESVRKRLETVKTVDELTSTIAEMKDEMLGVIYTSEETAQLNKLEEESDILWKEKRERDQERDRLYDEMMAVKPSYKLERDIENRKKRGWKYEEQEAKLKVAQEAYEKKRKAWSDFGREKKPRIDEIDKRRREIWHERRAIQEQAIKNNYENNPTTRAWASLGDRFFSVINYRGSSGSKTFRDHIYNAKVGKYKDWEWAKKDKMKTRKTSQKAVQFKLQVADSFNRKGGKPVKVDGTMDLKKMFNLRDVESGNWVLKDPGSAQFHVEKSAEAFSDLSDMTGVPVDKLSFNGRLAMAFGARGVGGSGAVAHYEPIKRVINLTKMGGGGSLAHEWFHSLDNLISEAQGGTSGAKDWGTEGSAQADPELREAFDTLIKAMTTGKHDLRETITYTPQDYKNADYNFNGRSQSILIRNLKEAGNLDSAIEIIDNAFAPDIERLESLYLKATNDTSKRRYKRELNKATKRRKDWVVVTSAFYGGNPEGGSAEVIKEKGVSSYLINARALESGTKDYWSSNVELGARAFSAYIEDKLQEKNRVSDYLSNGSNNGGAYALMGQKPFPEGEERKKINEAMDNLFNVINKNNIIQKSLDELVLLY